MLTLYNLMVYTHILSAVGAIGPFFAVIPIIRKLRTATPEELPHFIQLFHYVVQFSKHAGHVLVISGAILVFWGNWGWGSSWIVMTLVILFGTLFFSARAFSPLLKKLKEACETDKNGTDRQGVITRLVRAVFFYLAILLFILWLMVEKPTFWS